jgi:hypothetical protein
LERADPDEVSDEDEEDDNEAIPMVNSNYKKSI